MFCALLVTQSRFTWQLKKTIVGVNFQSLGSKISSFFFSLSWGELHYLCVNSRPLTWFPPQQLPSLKLPALLHFGSICQLFVNFLKFQFMSECKLQNLKFVEWDISAVFVTTHPWTRASQRKILCSYEGPSWIWWNNFSLWVDLHSFEISPGRIERGSRLSLKSPKRIDWPYKN